MLPQLGGAHGVAAAWLLGAALAMSSEVISSRRRAAASAARWQAMSSEVINSASFGRAGEATQSRTPAAGLEMPMTWAMHVTVPPWPRRPRDARRFVASVALATGLAASVAAPLAAQASAVVPPLCSNLPGNAAVAMPLRWSHGTLQVFVDAALLPSGLAGQSLTGLWLRRPTLPGDVAYAPITRTLTVRGGIATGAAAGYGGTLPANRPANLLTLFGPAPVTTLAAPAPSAATVVGGDLLHIVFSTPLPVTAGTLFLEFETGNAPLQISTEHWADAVWQNGGADQGYVATVGDGSCTTRSEPTTLRWTAAGGPSTPSTAAFELAGMPASGLVLMWAGVDAQARAPGAGFLGFGADLALVDAGLAGCRQWAPLDVTWSGAANSFGKFASTLAIPGSATLGLRLAVQGGWVDPSRPGLPLSLGNGLVLVVGAAGVGNRCSSMYFPAGATTSPWSPFVGQMPVLRLEY
jgi:hypothetical protein